VSLQLELFDSLNAESVGTSGFATGCAFDPRVPMGLVWLQKCQGNRKKSIAEAGKNNESVGPFAAADAKKLK
jgi:hypothetical protein